MTATAVPMPGGFIAPPIPAAPANPQTHGVPPAGRDAPLPNTQPAPTGADYGQPFQFKGQVPGYVQPQAPQSQEAFNAAVEAEIARRAALQQPQQQPQPTQPQVPAEKPSWLPTDLNAFDAQSLQDPILRSMAQMIQVVGKDLDLNRVLGNALARQDPSLIDMAYLVEKGGPQAQQIAQMAQGLVQSVAQQSDRITQDVYAQAGGEAAWDAATAMFNQSATPAFRQVVAQMLDSGDPSKIQAAAQAILEHGRARMPVPHQGVGSLPNGALGGGAGLSEAEFKSALYKLDNERNNNPNWEAARQELFAQRAHGLRLGK